MPPNRFESEVESFLEGSHGDRTHIKRADHHTVTPLCGTLLKLELSTNLTLVIPVIAAAFSGAGAYGKVKNPSELEVDRQEHQRAAYMVARQRGLSEREWYKVVEATKQS